MVSNSSCHLSVPKRLVGRLIDRPSRFPCIGFSTVMFTLYVVPFLGPASVGWCPRMFLLRNKKTTGTNTFR